MLDGYSLLVNGHINDFILLNIFLLWLTDQVQDVQQKKKY
jgi:hypothetical protein